MVPNDAFQKPTKVFSVKPINTKAAPIICVQICNRLAAPQIDGHTVVNHNVGGRLALAGKQGNFVIGKGRLGRQEKREDGRSAI